ncbi:ankyrin repeat domain-containing protein [Streptomyces sp. NPDC091273]|uniref:ankyrin repeat domain-containing protein n=1 Tax=Streptomyces sp. NPDC091273 TaxID=3365982 RepID=UPI00380647D2
MEERLVRSLESGDPLAVAVTAAIRGGDLPGLRDLLDAHPGLASARIVRRGAAAGERTLLHIATDWPGHYPRTAAVIRTLVAAGADVNAPGAVLGGGTPLTDACGFGQWRAARRLLALGARPDLQDAAALGLLDRVEEFLAAGAAPEDITSAFWQACHGGRLSTARRLLSHGADIDWIGYDRLTPLDIALTSGNAELIDWLKSSGAHTGRRLAPG